MTQPDWLKWAKQLQAVAQSGLTYCKDAFDIERYHKIRDISAEILQTHTNEPVEKIIDLFSAETGYATPKVGVRAAVIQYLDGVPHILLTRELVENGAWTMPGGFADIGDTPSEAVERETFEETGYEVKATKLLAVLDRNRLPNANPAWVELWHVLFLCKVTGGEAKPSIETGESRFFPLDALPDNTSPQRSPPQLLEWVKAHVADTTRSADYN